MTRFDILLVAIDPTVVHVRFQVRLDVFVLFFIFFILTLAAVLVLFVRIPLAAPTPTLLHQRHHMPPHFILIQLPRDRRSRLFGGFLIDLSPFPR